MTIMIVMMTTTVIHAMIVIMILKKEEEDTPEDEIGINMICLDCRGICDPFPVLHCATSCPNVYYNHSQIHTHKPATCINQWYSFTVSQLLS